MKHKHISSFETILEQYARGALNPLEAQTLLVGPILSILLLRNSVEPTHLLCAFLVKVDDLVALIRRVIENGSWYSVFKYLKKLIYLRYYESFQSADALASSNFGIDQHAFISLDKALDWPLLPPLTPPSQSHLVFQNVGTHNSERFGAGYFFSKLGYPLRVDVFPKAAISLHISYDRPQFGDQSGAGLLAAFRAVVERLADAVTGTVSILLDIAKAKVARGKAGASVREDAVRISDVRVASAA
ncbi:hypothetical protein [Agrobacterium vitis]|uniref:hypothetical protein n=1 Tax=Agrobacterium vitis TaxID=373 RepID=UPI003D2D5C3E